MNHSHFALGFTGLENRGYPAPTTAKEDAFYKQYVRRPSRGRPFRAISVVVAIVGLVWFAAGAALPVLG